MPRDASGNYTLPPGNPVAVNSVISATWANPTMDDLGNEITNSLDREGRGGMLVPFQNVDGTELQPGITFTTDLSLGWFREGLGDMRASAGGNARVRIFDDTSPAGEQNPLQVFDGVSFNPVVVNNFDGDLTFDGNLTVTGTVSALTLAGTLGTAAQPNITSVGSLLGLTIDHTGQGGGNSFAVIGNPGQTLLSVGSAGTAITDCFGTWDFNTAAMNIIGGNLNVSNSLVVTGAIDANGGVIGNVTGNVTGSAGTAATVTTAAQPAITSLGTLAGLNVTASANLNGGFSTLANSQVNGVLAVTGAPVALGATQLSLAADAAFGGVITGFGTSFDVSLRARDGTRGLSLIAASGFINIPSLAGVGVRAVGADDAGNLTIIP